MKTIHSLSTAELRKLETEFERPKTLTESIILSGVRHELQSLQSTHDQVRGFSVEDECERVQIESVGSVEERIEEIIGVPA